jgi:cytochrome c
MKTANLTWDATTLDRYLENPRAAVPGTNMAFAGLRKPEDRRDVIAYIAVESQR